MGFYTTETCPEVADLPLKNRVGGSRRSSPLRAGRFTPQPFETVSETAVTFTITVSGLSFWLSRDPIEEKGSTHLYCYAWNEPIGTWDILGREPESVAKQIILVEKKEEAGGEKPPEIDTHTGFLLVQCCNACPTLLSNYRVLDEWAEPKVLLSLPATNPDGLYAVDAVYTPGVAYKVPGLTLMRPFVLTCDCAAKVVSVSYHPRFIEPVIPWEVGKDRPKKFPDKWPKPYKSTPGDSEK